MTDLEQGELRVVVPVGFLLAEPQEVTVSVDRPGGAPLPVRLQLIPAQPVPVAAPASVSEPTPLNIGWNKRSKLVDPDDAFLEPEYGGSD
ncbi:MAG: hypothetical protein L0241_15075 [Planctomycetia bacterium]|nr:hypothetical protein [Planctomycetia bacterium]